MDLHIEVPSLTAAEIAARNGRAADDAGDIRARVEAARVVQTARFGRGSGLVCNAQIGLRELEQHCSLDDRTRAYLQRVVEALSLSARAAHRSLRVARTIADLAGEERVLLPHLAEAVQYQGAGRGNAL